MKDLNKYISFSGGVESTTMCVLLGRYCTRMFKIEPIDKFLKNTEMEKCTNCNGTGDVICTNPDHGLIEILSFHDIGRIGCPACGHSGICKCDECNGTGIN